MNDADESTTTESPTTAGWSAIPPQLLLLYRRVLAGNPGLGQLWFKQRVLSRYREQAGARVIRTNTAGRVRAAAGWSVDFGISAEDELIHLAIADLTERVPATEQVHWLAHAVALPISPTFLTMRLGAGSCMDDGEVRDW